MTDRENQLAPLTLNPSSLGLPTGPQSDVTKITNCLLEAHRQCNVLAPAMQIDYLPPDHVISFMTVLFPIDGITTRKKEGKVIANSTQSNGVWYATDGGGLALHRAALDMLAQAAGLTWLYEECGRTDDRKTPCLWSYRMTCEVKGLDGSTRKITREYELDLREGSAAAAKAGQGIRSACIHGAQLCESKASNRCVRAALGLRAYSVEEANKPFVFPVLRWVPPTDDPMIRRMIAAKELGVIDELFGAEAKAGSVHLIEPGTVIPATSHEPKQLQAPSDIPEQMPTTRRPVTNTRQQAYDAEAAFEAGDPWDQPTDAGPSEQDLIEYCKAHNWKIPEDFTRLAAHVQGDGAADFQAFISATR